MWSPWNTASSATFTIATMSEGGCTCTRPPRSLAAPTPPARTVITAAPYRPRRRRSVGSPAMATTEADFLRALNADLPEGVDWKAGAITYLRELVADGGAEQEWFHLVKPFLG